MLWHPSLSAFLVALCLSGFAGTPAFACACCSSDGQRYVGTEKRDGNAILPDIAFAADAHLYTGEADVSDTGLGAEGPDFKLSVAKGQTVWRFTFTQGDAAGTLDFPLPAEIGRFEVDSRHPSTSPPGTGPMLYKEWQLAGVARGGGVFADAVGSGRKATLILHGHGNSCTDVSQFNAWTLVLSGDKGDTTFYGELIPP